MQETNKNDLCIDTQLLSMCSTRNRPQQCKRMINSFIHTKRGKSQLAIYISTDDPRYQEYIRLKQQYQKWADESKSDNCVHFHIGTHKYMIPVLNYFSTQVYPGIKFYQEINDDHVYISQGWDVILMQAIKDRGGWGIAYAFNGVNHEPSARVFSGNIIKTLGFFNPRCIRHTWGDDWTARFGKHFNFLLDISHITIDHICWHDTVRGLGARMRKDSNVEFVYGQQQWAFGTGRMNNYYANDWYKDIKKIEDAMNEQKNIKGMEK